MRFLISCLLLHVRWHQEADRADAFEKSSKEKQEELEHTKKELMIEKEEKEASKERCTELEGIINEYDARFLVVSAQVKSLSISYVFIIESHAYFAYHFYAALEGS